MKLTKRVMERELKFPERDIDARKAFSLMLVLCKKCTNSLTIQELELICRKRGYLKPLTKKEKEYLVYAKKQIR